MDGVSMWPQWLELQAHAEAAARDGTHLAPGVGVRSRILPLSAALSIGGKSAGKRAKEPGDALLNVSVSVRPEGIHVVAHKLLTGKVCPCYACSCQECGERGCLYDVWADPYEQTDLSAGREAARVRPPGSHPVADSAAALPGSGRTAPFAPCERAGADAGASRHGAAEHVGGQGGGQEAA